MTSLISPLFRPTCFVLTVLSASVVSVACANQSQQNYQNDNSIYQFSDAERAAGRGDISALYGFENSMRGGLFEMYPTYWRLNTNLGSQDVASIYQFGSRYQGTAMGEKLVADYAEAKATQSDYASVRAVANLIENADNSEACAVALGFNQSNDNTRALTQKGDVWLNTQVMPSLCDKLADEMAYNSRISQTDRHEQLIRMMRIDQRRLSSSRPATNKQAQIVTLARQLNLPISSDTLATIRSNPKQFISTVHTSPFSEVNQYLYVYAISQLAHRSYWEAASQIQSDILQDDLRSQRVLTDMARRYAWRSVAVKRMNMNTDDGFNMEAVTWFRNSLGEPFNFEEAEDYAQVAIYFGQWQDVQTAINAMSMVKQQERVWQYWLARSLEAQGKRGESTRIYQNLATGIDYYGLLAKDRLGQRLSLQDVGGNTAPTLSAQDVNELMKDEHFARAILLMRQDANPVHIQREWNWAVKKARDAGNTRLPLLAAKMAQDMGNYPRSIYAIENSPEVRNGALSHPMPFYDSTVRHSRSVGIDPAWAYGIMRQESRFQTAAQSGAAASGLMQIIPGTARQIARGMGESVGSMTNPDTNIRYGTWYLADLAGKAGGQIVVATAGYNAGPNAAAKWLPRQGSISADQYVEAIPYVETRAYVKHVMENATIYSTLMGNTMPISQRMGMVSPAW